jgi:tRNA A37 threonylcarbamoyltransferase TsaD
MNRLFRQNPRIEAAPLDDEAILFDPTASKFFMLNRTSSFVWQRLSTPSSAKTLADELCKHFDSVVPSDVLNDVEHALEQMLSMDLVVAGDAAVNPQPRDAAQPSPAERRE